MTPEPFDQPMHPIFTPWCAAASRHERLVRKHVPDSDPGCALQSTSMPALHGRNVPNCRPMADGGMRKCSAGACPPQGSGWGSAKSTVPIRCTKPQLPLFIPWYAGTSRHERFVRKQMVPVTPAGPVAPAQAGIQGRTVCIALPPIHRGERIEVRVKRSPDTSHSREQKGRLVALGVVPSKNHPAGRQTSAENTRRSPAVPAESLPQ